MATRYHFHSYPTRARRNDSQKLQEYRVLKELGVGAFSKVSLAHHSPTCRKVALKRVNMEELEEKYVNLCKNEVSLLMKIDSKNVIKCFDAFTVDKKLFVSLEYIDGGDMASRIIISRDRGMIFSERTIWYFFHQICAGLKDMHEMRILHRDLKPANIFVGNNGKIKIGDLGLSRLFSIRTQFAHTRVGTEYYMSPERNESGGYHFKSDIWSLGCLLYEMCTFRSPFNGEVSNAYALHKKIKYGDIIPFPMDVYSEQLIDFTYSCLSLSPENRPDIKEAHEAARIMYVKFEQMLAAYKAQLSQHRL